MAMELRGVCDGCGDEIPLYDEIFCGNCMEDYQRTIDLLEEENIKLRNIIEDLKIFCS